MPNNARNQTKHRAPVLPVLRISHGSGGSHHVEVPVREDQAGAVHKARRTTEEAENGTIERSPFRHPPAHLDHFVDASKMVEVGFFFMG